MNTYEDTSLDLSHDSEEEIQQELVALQKILASSKKIKGINYKRVLEVQNKLLNGELAALGDIKSQYASAVNIANRITQGNFQL
jgi:type IV secretory pathway VirB4 component